MLIDLLSSSNLGTFNIHLANLIGLHPAIYLSELVAINEKAVRKNKIEDNLFKVDRNYIQSRTTLSKEEQISIDEILIKLGLVEKPDEKSDRIKLNLDKLVSITLSETEKIRDNISKIVVKTKREQSKDAKLEAIKNQLKAVIKSQDPRLKEAYGNWIDTIYMHGDILSAPVVRAFENDISTYTKGDAITAVKIITYASAQYYKIGQWAINAYTKQTSLSYKTSCNSYNNFSNNSIDVSIPDEPLKLGNEEF